MEEQEGVCFRVRELNTDCARTELFAVGFTPWKRLQEANPRGPGVQKKPVNLGPDNPSL